MSSRSEDDASAVVRLVMVIALTLAELLTGCLLATIPAP